MERSNRAGRRTAIIPVALGLLGASLSGCPAPRAAVDAGAPVDASTLDGSRPDAGPVVGIDAGRSDVDAGPRECQSPAVSVPVDAVDVTHLSLGMVELGDTGVSEPLRFELPAGVDSFQVSVRSPEDVALTIRRLEAPSRLLVTDVRPAEEPIPWPAQLYSAHRVVSGRGGAGGSFTRALAPRAPLEGGAHTMWIEALERTACPVSVDIYYRARPVERGRLAVALYFAPGIAVAPEDEVVTRALDRVRAIYAAASIDIEVTSASIVAGLPASTSDVAATLRRVPPPFVGVPLVFVEHVEDRTDAGSVRVNGRAGGIPGDPFAAGAALGGVVVSVAPAGVVREPDELARTLAHELGHHLGLHHTEDVATGFYDQLDDTPTASPNDNLMLSGGSGVAISPLQAIALRSAVAVRAAP